MREPDNQLHFDLQVGCSQRFNANTSHTGLSTVEGGYKGWHQLL